MLILWDEDQFFRTQTVYTGPAGIVITRVMLIIVRTTHVLAMHCDDSRAHTSEPAPSAPSARAVTRLSPSRVRNAGRPHRSALAPVIPRLIVMPRKILGVYS